MWGENIRHIVIGSALILVGAIVLLYSFGVIRADQFDLTEKTLVLWCSSALLLIGVGLLVAFFFKLERTWILMVSLSMFFLGISLYVYYNFSGNQELLVLSLFLLASISFFATFIRDREQEWGLLVGWICVGLASSVWAATGLLGLPETITINTSILVPFFLLGGVALGFISVWLVDPRRYWWALLTAGLVIAVISTMTVQATQLNDEYGPIILFLIAGLVFFAAWLLRNEENKLGWAIYPVAVLIPLSAFLFSVKIAANYTLINLSSILILVGLIFVASFFWARRVPKMAKPKPDYFPSTTSDEKPFDEWEDEALKKNKLETKEKPEALAVGEPLGPPKAKEVELPDESVAERDYLLEDREKEEAAEEEKPTGDLDKILGDVGFADEEEKKEEEEPKSEIEAEKKEDEKKEGETEDDTETKDKPDKGKIE